MKETLPEKMIAVLEELGKQLAAMTEEQRGASLAILEEKVLGAVRAVLPDLLGEVLRESIRELQPPACHWRQSCPRCGGHSVGVHSWRLRTVRTVCGAVRYERPWYSCRSCRHGFAPADVRLGVQRSARVSTGLETWLVDLGGHTDFREAAYLLKKLTGLEVSAETVRQWTEQEGTVLETEAQRAGAEVERTQEAAAPLRLAPGQLVVETDGVMVRYRDGWHEVKLVLVGGYVDGHLEAVSYDGTRASPDVFGPRLLAEAARRGALEVIAWEGPTPDSRLPRLRPVVILGDGALWIWNLAGEHFGEQRIEIVDFYHAAEHLWTVAKVLHSGDQDAAAWASAQIHDLRHFGIAPVAAALREARAETPVAAKVLRRERGYFRTNAARMDYPTFHANGLPIGSGAIESAAKHVVQLRMKRPGARWSEPGAQAVLNVRCQLSSALPAAA
jgi:hypothetical protein